MNSLSSWSQCCRMGVEQEVSHWRIVANQETGSMLLGCRSKYTEAKLREKRTTSITGALNIAATRPPVKNEGI